MPNSTLGMLYIKVITVLLVALNAWGIEIDFSRRTGELQKTIPSMNPDPQGNRVKRSYIQGQEFIESLFKATGSEMDIVILHTDTGFVPKTLYFMTDQLYRVHVVNVSKKQKNSSFIFDAFAEHHGIYFGEQKTFEVHPRQNGTFSFFSPESGYRGEVMVRKKMANEPVTAMK